jgi:hypothetical protein
MAIIFKGNRVAGVGKPGESAYEAAKRSGYEGTEIEFSQEINDAINFEEFLTAHNIDETAHPHILQLIDEKIADSAKPNWDVNDPEDPAYIENRTHYKAQGFGDIIPVQTFNFNYQYPLGYCHYFDPWPSDTIIEDGKEYVVFWDGVSYNITAMA